MNTKCYEDKVYLEQNVRILVVEDDFRTALLLSDILKGAGYQVTCAPNGETAQELLHKAQSMQALFHVVVTDLVMHGVDGIEVLHSARHQQPAAEVILLTGFGSVTSAINALRGGAYDYLLKPCKASQLLTCVAGAVEQVTLVQRQDAALARIAESQHSASSSDMPPLNRMPAISAPPQPTSEKPLKAEEVRYLEAGSLLLDCFRYVAFFDNQELALTPTEFSVLHCLIEAQGSVLSYQEIVRHTHRYKTTVNEAQALLKAHIYHLRRKIDPSYIVNIRGVGYLLAPPSS